MAPGDLTETSDALTYSELEEEWQQQRISLSQQQRLLDILRDEFTRVCERFCQDANESASRLDQARLLLAGALKVQSEHEAEHERLMAILAKTQTSARLFLHETCARELVETKAQYTSLFADLLQDDDFGLTQMAAPDRQNCLEFLRYEPKWWSIEEVLDDFEGRVNLQFQHSDGVSELEFEEVEQGSEPVVNDACKTAPRHAPSQVLAMNAVSVDPQEMHSPGAPPEMPPREIASITPTMSMSRSISLEETSVGLRDATTHVTFARELPQPEVECSLGGVASVFEPEVCDVPETSTQDDAGQSKQNFSLIHGSRFLSNRALSHGGAPRFPGAQGRAKLLSCPSAPVVRRPPPAHARHPLPVWVPPVKEKAPPKLGPKPFVSGSRKEKLAQKLAEEGHRVLVESKPRSPRPHAVDWVVKPSWKASWSEKHREQPQTLVTCDFGGREITKAALLGRRHGASVQALDTTAPAGPPVRAATRTAESEVNR